VRLHARLGFDAQKFDLYLIMLSSISKMIGPVARHPFRDRADPVHQGRSLPRLRFAPVPNLRHGASGLPRPRASARGDINVRWTIVPFLGRNPKTPHNHSKPYAMSSCSLEKHISVSPTRLSRHRVEAKAVAPFSTKIGC
jgi:hypothetical protein